jgi:excisionase family DNA binding protein
MSNYLMTARRVRGHGGPITASVAGFCDLSGLHRSRVYELIAAGAIESIKIGKRRLILMDSYHQLIERQRAAGAGMAPRPGKSRAAG